MKKVNVVIKSTVDILFGEQSGKGALSITMVQH